MTPIYELIHDFRMNALRGTGKVDGIVEILVTEPLFVHIVNELIEHQKIPEHKRIDCIAMDSMQLVGITIRKQKIQVLRED